MALFAVAVLSAPFAAAFLAPALLAARPGWKAVLAGHAALLALLTLLGLIAGAPAGTIAASAAFTTALAILGAGAHLAAGPAASGLLVVLLGSALWAGRPLVDEAVDRGADPSARLEWLLAATPWAVADASILGRDVLRERILYSESHYADFVSTARYPSWGVVAGVHLAAGAVLAGLGLWRRRRACTP